MTNEQQVELINAIAKLCYLSHSTATVHGFYENLNQNVGEKTALIHSELGEFTEANRKTVHERDEHCPSFFNVEIELADTCIRIFDLAEWQKLRLGEAIVAKMLYNASRPYKHGKAF